MKPVNLVQALDLHVSLPSGRGRGSALREELRAAIGDNRLRPGETLPPYRVLAQDLGISRSVVAQAYGELIDDGWLVARQGSGTVVGSHHLTAAPSRAAAPPIAGHRELSAENSALDLRQGLPAFDLFPRQDWVRATRTVMTNAGGDIFRPMPPAGLPALREALARYLQRTRGVTCTGDDVIVCGGYAEALRLVMAITPRRRHLLESAGLPFHEGIVRTAAATVELLAVDELGAVPPPPRHAEGYGSAAVHLTPAHQFPLGVPLVAERRQQFISAVGERGVIIEDDYDGEFRYDRRPIGALQALAPERVVYVGSASKALSPAMRLGWIVAPRAMQRDLLVQKGVREQHVSGIMQATFARLLADGAYDRHVRAARNIYRRRRQELLDVVRPHQAMRPLGVPAGLHLAVSCDPELAARTLARLRDRGVEVDDLAEFTRRKGAEMGEGNSGFVVGFSAPSKSRWPEALATFARALGRPGSTGNLAHS